MLLNRFWIPLQMTTTTASGNIRRTGKAHTSATKTKTGIEILSRTIFAKPKVDRIKPAVAVLLFKPTDLDFFEAMILNISPKILQINGVSTLKHIDVTRSSPTTLSNKGSGQKKDCIKK